MSLVPVGKETYFTDKRARILLKTRLDKMDSMIANPSDEELNGAIRDAIDSYNLIAPMTNLSAADAVTLAENSPAYDYILLIGGCYNIMLTIWNDWAHSGDEITLSILSEPDRMDRFESLMNEFKEDFEEKSEAFKKNNNIRTSVRSYSSTSRGTGYGSGRGSRRSFKSNYRGC